MKKKIIPLLLLPLLLSGCGTKNVVRVNNDGKKVEQKEYKTEISESEATAYFEDISQTYNTLSNNAVYGKGKDYHFTSIEINYQKESQFDDLLNEHEIEVKSDDEALKASIREKTLTKWSKDLLGAVRLLGQDATSDTYMYYNSEVNTSYLYDNNHESIDEHTGNSLSAYVALMGLNQLNFISYYSMASFLSKETQYSLEGSTHAKYYLDNNVFTLTNIYDAQKDEENYSLNYKLEAIYQMEWTEGGNSLKVAVNVTREYEYTYKKDVIGNYVDPHRNEQQYAFREGEKFSWKENRYIEETISNSLLSPVDVPTWDK